MRILIVDDNALIAELMAEMLREHGHVVFVETSESGAVSAAAREQPDLMIVDVRLGQGSGVRAMEQVQRTRLVPHVFMSGRRLPAGTTALLKPFRECDLRQEMDRALAAVPAASLP